MICTNVHLKSFPHEGRRLHPLEIVAVSVSMSSPAYCFYVLRVTWSDFKVFRDQSDT